MFAVIFEVEPRPGRTDDYLRIAASLRPDVDKIDGFVEIERFASRRREGRVLSLSIWRDEAAVRQWREFGAHSAAQRQGRSEIFADYRIRVGEIAGADATGIAQIVTITELSEAAEDISSVVPQGAADAEWFESLSNPGKFLLLAGWRDGAAAERWRPEVVLGECRHRRIRIIRDYGLAERAEAPQP
jgi:heme-degrading monooxygenase HmoA